jgi:hypothetical protein
VIEKLRSPKFYVKLLVSSSIALVIALYLMYLGRGNNFFFDEWMFITGRRGLSVDALLSPHNGHLSALPALAFMVLLKFFGLDHYEAFRFAAIIVHLLVALMASLLIRKNHGWSIGITVFVAIGLMGAGWQNIFWGFQIGFMGSLFFFLLSLYLLDHGRTQNRNISFLLSSISLACSLLCAGLGVAGLAVIAMLCLFSTDRQRTWWIPVGPALMYALWYLKYGTSQAKLSAVDGVPLYASESASGSAAGLFGVDRIWGALLIGALIYLCARLALRRRLTMRSVALIVFALVFWTMVGLSRTVVWEPNASRYLYVGIVALVVGIFDLVFVSRPMNHWSLSQKAGAVSVAFVAIWGSHASLVQGAQWLKNEGDIVGAELAVVEMHRDTIDPSIAVDPLHAFMLPVGAYLSAVDDLGSSAAIDPQELPNASEQARLGADLLLNSLVKPQTISDRAMCQVENRPESRMQVTPGSTVVLKVLRVAAYGISRFAPQEVSRAGMQSIEAGLFQIEIPDDVVEVPWILTFENPTDVRICDM